MVEDRTMPKRSGGLHPTGGKAGGEGGAQTGTSAEQTGSAGGGRSEAQASLHHSLRRLRPASLRPRRLRPARSRGRRCARGGERRDAAQARARGTPPTHMGGGAAGRGDVPRGVGCQAEQTRPTWQLKG